MPAKGGYGESLAPLLGIPTGQFPNLTSRWQMCAGGMSRRPWRNLVLGEFQHHVSWLLLRRFTYWTPNLAFRRSNAPLRSGELSELANREVFPRRSRIAY